MKITLRFKQINQNLYRLAGATNTTEFKINSYWTQEEVNELIKKKINFSVSANS